MSSMMRGKEVVQHQVASAVLKQCRYDLFDALEP